MTKTCSNCNQTNPPDAAFCLNCSTPIAPTVGGPAYQQRQPYVGGQAPYVGAPPQPYGGQDLGMRGGNQGGASTRSIVSLCLAIASLVLCCGLLTGVPAAILGWMELDAINKGTSPQAGRIFAQIGLWGGAVISVLSIIFTLLWFFLSIIPFAM